MFWLYDDKNEYTFYQIYPYYKKINNVYKFDKNIVPYNKLNTYIYDVKIKDNIISFSDTKILTFKKIEEFIDEKNNKLNLPMFKFNYTKIDNACMPNTNDSFYDFNEKITFGVYTINKNTLYVVETIDENVKNYVLCNNLDNYTLN